MLRTSSRTHTMIYAILLSIVIICITVHFSNFIATQLDPNDPNNMIYMSVLVSGILAPPVSFLLALYSNQLIHVQEELRELAVSDPLTGLYNRRAFEEIFARETARSKRTGNPVSLVLFDIDYFKKVNAEHGHAGGDVALRNVAETIRRTIRYGTDEGARWGGEEFVILLGETAHENAGHAANRLRAAIEKMDLLYEEQRINITASFGVTECKPDDKLVDVVARADKCLRYAKKQGRNTVVLHPKLKTMPSAQAAA
ncbi:MAG: GGDEF domain-containing protein [Pseudomonadota bacterium]